MNNAEFKLYYHYYLQVLSIICNYFKKFQEKWPSILEYTTSCKGLITKMVNIIVKKEAKKKSVFEWKNEHFLSDEVKAISCSPSDIVENLRKGSKHRRYSIQSIKPKLEKIY